MGRWMRERPLIEAKIEQFRDRPGFVAHQVLLDLNEQILGRMNELGLRSKDLADLLGVSRAYVTRLLDGKPNLTVRSLAAIAIALETQLNVSLQPRAIRSWGAESPDWLGSFETARQYGQPTTGAAEDATVCALAA